MTKLSLVTDAGAAQRKEDADILRRLADKVESGEVTEFAVVANDRQDGTYYRACAFTDRWKMLGALEHAKQSVHDG